MKFQITFWLLNVKNLTRFPKINYSNHKKIAIKPTGLWGTKAEKWEKYISFT